ncbi:MAG TPA: hypothetical protein VGS21_06100 [Acidimicrobiales bacterium]|nr:hypothetical protein [Acidimicrobiales bacterium]
MVTEVYTTIEAKQRLELLVRTHAGSPYALSRRERDEFPAVAPSKSTKVNSEERAHMATKEDANLIVQVLRWGTEMGLEDALRHIFSDDFEPTASMEDPAVGKALAYGEIISTLVKHDLLDGDLVRDMIWIEGIWSRVAPSALAAREKANEPRLYENFEAFIGVPVALGAA